MRLRNKKTGEIIDDGYVRETHDFQFDGQKHVLAVFKGNGHRPPERVSGAYTSLAELNEEWEDYEEPKEYWFINSVGGVIRPSDTTDWEQQDAIHHKEIGNYFETEEEAEKAVEKLKALKRLKDKGFRFKADSLDICCHTINFKVDRQFDMADETSRDLHLLFGGEKMSSINDLPAFPPVSLTNEQAEKLAQMAKEAREEYEKNKKDEPKGGEK